MGVVTRHETGPRRTAISTLAVCLSETGTFRCQLVYVRCLADLVTVAGQGGRSQVIRDDEEDVWLFRASEWKKPDQKERMDGEGFHMSSMMFDLPR